MTTATVAALWAAAVVVSGCGKTTSKSPRSGSTQVGKGAVPAASFRPTSTVALSDCPALPPPIPSIFYWEGSGAVYLGGPLPSGVAITRDQLFACRTPEPDTWPADGRMYLDVYRPTAPSPTPRPVVVILYPGGLSQSNGGTKFLPGVQRAAVAATQAGLVAITLDYRQLPEGQQVTTGWLDPGAQKLIHRAGEDVASALLWLDDHAAELGADPERVGLLGESAGSFAALDAAWSLGATPAEVIAQAGIADPAAIAANRDVRVVMIHGANDQTVPIDQARAACDRANAVSGQQVCAFEVTSAPGADGHAPPAAFIEQAISRLAADLR